MINIDLSKLQVGDVVFRIDKYIGSSLDLQTIAPVAVVKILKNSVTVRQEDGTEIRYTMSNTRWGKPRSGRWRSSIDYLVSEEDGRKLFNEKNDLLKLRKIVEDSNIDATIRIVNGLRSDRSCSSKDGFREVISAMRTTPAVLESGIVDKTED